MHYRWGVLAIASLEASLRRFAGFVCCWGVCTAEDGFEFIAAKEG